MYSSVPDATPSAAVPCLVKDRGMYFKSSDSRYIVDPNILNISGAIDTFMRCTACNEGTIFSRNKNINTSNGDEEYFKLYLSESNGSDQLSLSFKT